MKAQTLFALAAMILLLGANSYLQAAEIRGRVTGVGGTTVTIVLKGDLAPKIGDPATIYFTLPGFEDEVLVGTGKVSSVNENVVTAAIDSLKGTLETDQLARISSENPIAKSPTPTAVADSSPAHNLTGTWSCSDKGTYVIKQAGNRVTWEAKSADNGRTWSHSFEGEINGDMITGRFTDHPPGRIRGKGSLTVKIASATTLEKISSTTPFGGERWQKTGDQTTATAAPAMFRGKYTAGFEMSEFVPCDKDERWWLTGKTNDLQRVLKTAPKGVRQTIFVEVAGQLTPKGRYGHLGGYNRQLSVDRVILARELRDGDCF